MERHFVKHRSHRSNFAQQFFDDLCLAPAHVVLREGAGRGFGRAHHCRRDNRLFEQVEQDAVMWQEDTDQSAADEPAFCQDYWRLNLRARRPES